MFEMGRAIRDAREAVERLTTQETEAAEGLAHGQSWLCKRPDDEQWQDFVTVSASTLASIRRELVRARERLRALHVRGALRLGLPPRPAPRRPVEQLSLLLRMSNAPRSPREDLPTQPGPATVPELPAEGPPAGGDLVPAQCAPRAGEDLQAPPTPATVPAEEMEQLAEDDSAPATVPELPGEDLHEQPGPATAPAEEMEQLADSELLAVDELPPRWCELCRRTVAGVQWHELRQAYLCPSHWPMEGMRLGVAA